MSRDYSGPDYGFPHGDARLELTDLYAFPKPGDAAKSEEATRSHGRFCRTSSFMIPRGRCPILSMAGHSGTTSWMASFPSSEMEG
jgi:hypothetical protein